MAGSLRFDIIARDLASRAFRNVGDAARRASIRLDEFGERSRRLQAASGQVGKALKFPAIASGAAIAGGAVASLTAGVVSLGAAAAPAAGALAGVGAAGAALGQGVLVAKIATSGLGDAMKAVNAVQTAQAAGFKATAAQVKKVATTYGLTSAAGQQLVRTLLTQADAFDKMKDRVQGILLPQLASSIQTLGSTYMPLLTRSTMATAGVLRDLAADATYAFSGKVWRQDVQTILTTNVGLLRTLGGAALPLANVVRNIWVPALPLAQRFATFVQDAAFRVSILTSTARSSGALGRFFQLAGDTAAQLGRIVGNVAAALLNVGRAAFGAGQQLLASLEGATRRMREFTGSAAGAAKLRGYFEQAVPVVKETGRLIGAVAVAFFRLGENQALAPLIRQVRVQLLPALERLLFGLSGQFGSLLVELATRVVSIFARLTAGGGALTAFVGTLNRMAAVFERILASPLGPVVQQLLKVAGTAAAIGLVVGAVGRLGASLLRLVTFFNPVRLVVVAVAAGLTLAYKRSEEFRGIVNRVGDALRTSVLPALFRLGRSLTDTVVPAFARLGNAVGGDALSGLRRLGDFMVRTIVPALARFAGFLTDTVLPAVVRLGQFVETVVVPALLRFGREAVASLLPRLQQFGAFLTGTVFPALRSVADFIARNFVPALRAVGGFLIGTVFPALKTVGGFLVRTFTPTFRALGEYFTTGLFPALRGLFVRVRENLPQFISFAKFVGGVAAVVAGALLPILIKLETFLVRVLFAAIGKMIGIFGGLVRGVKAGWEMFQTFRDNVGDVVRRVGLFIREMVARIRVQFFEMAESVTEAVADAFSWVPGVGEKLRQTADRVRTMRQNANRELDEVNAEKARQEFEDLKRKIEDVPTAAFVDIHTKADYGQVTGPRRAATGGFIRGPGTSTSDSIPALLSNGEYVVRASAVRKYGADLFDKFNTHRFAKGGHVGCGCGQHPGDLRAPGSSETGRFANPMSQARYDRLLKDRQISFHGQDWPGASLRRAVSAWQNIADLEVIHGRGKNPVRSEWNTFLSGHEGVPLGRYVDAQGRVVVYKEAFLKYPELSTLHTLAHEVGHAISLNHDRTRGQLMYPFSYPGAPVSPRARDKARLRAAFPNRWKDTPDEPLTMRELLRVKFPEPYQGSVPGAAKRVRQFYLASIAATINADLAGDAPPRGGGGPLGGGSVMGYRRQMEVLRRVFRGLQLISGFRPGAITATGNPSYHGKGRAVDVPPRMDVFNWIRSNYGAKTKELIFSPAGGRQLHNGRPHYYTGVTRRMHFNHVHWAMADGGVIGEPVLGVGTRSGQSYSFAERGPEAVLPIQRGGGERRDELAAAVGQLAVALGNQREVTLVLDDGRQLRGYMQEQVDAKLTAAVRGAAYGRR